jgi:photosynthetic reaction center H subunit
MSTGAITSYIDVAQITLYVFWVFFALLVWHLRQEDRREGYPLEADGKGMTSHSMLFIPDAKTFNLPHGGTKSVPDGIADTRAIKASRRSNYPGTPLEPTGNPMADGVGAAAYAERADEPDMTFDNRVKIVPMSADAHFSVAEEDVDPRGKNVIGADGQVAGTVADIWVDRAEQIIRYYEMKLEGSPRARSRLIPSTACRVDAQGNLLVNSILGSQFAGVPTTSANDQVTLLEEDKIMGYYAGGRLYATPARQEPLL